MNLGQCKRMLCCQDQYMLTFANMSQGSKGHRKSRNHLAHLSMLTHMRRCLGHWCLSSSKQGWSRLNMEAIASMWKNPAELCRGRLGRLDRGSQSKAYTSRGCCCFRIRKRRYLGLDSPYEFSHSTWLCISPVRRKCFGLHMLCHRCIQALAHHRGLSRQS